MVRDHQVRPAWVRSQQGIGDTSVFLTAALWRSACGLGYSIRDGLAPAGPLLFRAQLVGQR